MLLVFWGFFWSFYNLKMWSIKVKNEHGLNVKIVLHETEAQASRSTDARLGML